MCANSLPKLSLSTRFCAERKTPPEYQISKNKIEMFFADVPCQGHYSTNTNHFCNARLLSCHGLAQIVTWKNGNENIPPVPLQALSTWNPSRRSHTLHTCWPQVRKGNPFPVGEVLFVGVSPSVTTRLGIPVSPYRTQNPPRPENPRKLLKNYNLAHPGPVPKITEKLLRNVIF